MIGYPRSLGIVIAIGLALLAPARSEADKWSGTQIVTAVSVERSLGSTPLGVQAFISRFSVPSKDEGLTFAYVGPTLRLERGKFQIWIALQGVGGFGYWPGHDAFGPSLWTQIDYDGMASLFAEIDYWRSSGDRSLWYGLYAFDLHPTDWLQVGSQIEQVNAGMHGGPHVGIAQGPVIVQLQFHEGMTMDDETKALRIFLLAHF